MPAPARPLSLEWLAQNGVTQPEVALEFARGAPLLAASFAAERDLAAIATVREHWQAFIFGDKSPSSLATEAASQLNTRESITPKMLNFPNSTAVLLNKRRNHSAAT
jgi:hypothetical protein